MNIEIDTINRYEAGELMQDEELEFFSQLISTGLAWTLQGRYGRDAQWFIDNGIILADGTIIGDPINANS